MNKLFTKIVGVALGLTMAIGIGVAVGSSSKEVTPVNAASAEWELVTSALSDWSGDYILANGSSGTVKILDGSSFNSSTSFSGIDATVSNSKITADDADALTIAKSSTSGKYTVKVNGKFVGRNANSNGVDSATTWTSNYDNSISYSSGKVIIAGNGGRVLLWFNSNSNFRYYASSNEHNTQLFRKVESTKTLSSIAVTTAPTKTTYYVGDSFDSTGMVVTASYSSGSPVEVTDKCEFSPATFTTTGNQDVSVSYTEGGVTETTKQAVTVIAAPTAESAEVINDMTTKTYVEGTAYDVTGLTLRVTYDNDDTRDFDFAEDLTKDTDYILDHDNAVLGDTSLDITGVYLGCEFDFTVTGITVSAAPDVLTDVLDRTLTGVSGTSYSAWDDKAGSSGSGAVYAGQSAGPTSGTGAGSIQLRATSPSGIWTTSSGGIFAGIEVTWHSSTAEGRTIEIYGKSSAYASADLYDNSKRGTLIGEIAKGSSTIEGNFGEYEYIGIKSKSGALYLTEIDISWAAADPVIEYEDSSTTANLVVINGSTNTIDFNAKNFASVSAGIFSNTPTNSNSSYANLSYSVSGTTVTVTVTGKAVGSESFTISATGCANTLTLNVTVQASTTFDSLVISTATTATSFNEDEAFAVTGLVVTANYTVGGSPSTVEFSSSEGNLEQLTYTVGGSPIKIGDPLTSTGTLSVVVSYTDSATSTTRSAAAYNITVNAYVAHTWTKVTTAPADWRGTYLLGYEKDGTFYAFNSSLETFDATFNTVNTTSVTSGVVTGSKALDAVAIKIERNTIKGTSYYHALCANGEYLKSASKSINHQKTATEAVAVTFDGVELKIGDYWLRFNTAKDQLRFRFGDSAYLSSTTASLYKMNVTDSINTEVSNFVSGFHSSIGGVCDASGVDTDTSALNSAWTTQATAFKALSVDAQGILANTTYIHNAETPGSTADIIDRYDYVYGKYSASLTKGDFMNRSDAGTLVTYSARVNPFNIIENNGNPVAIIVVISMISVTCIGGYFFIRRRKEQ